MDSEDPTAARKLQKAGREKQRRCRLNEQFIELGNTLDADRPKNDKSTIISDTIQLLNDLTAEVNKLETEHASLNEESRELTQEKNDLKEEKATLKSDIERLNAQCQQRAGSAYPWAMDSGHPHPPSYPYPMPFSIPSAPIPMHVSMQPYPFYGSPNPGMFANPCSTYLPYMTPNPPAEQPSTQGIPTSLQPGSKTQVSARQGVGTSSDKQERRNNKNEDSNGVATNLELKTPGSTTDEDTSSVEKSRQKLLQKKSIAADGSSSRQKISLSRCTRLKRENVSIFILHVFYKIQSSVRRHSKNFLCSQKIATLERFWPNSCNFYEAKEVLNIHWRNLSYVTQSWSWNELSSCMDQS